MNRHGAWAWAWTGLILLACWLPSHKLPHPETDKAPVWGIHIPHLDKAVHFGMFAGFAILWSSAACAVDRRGLVLAAGLALAVITELGQMIPMIHRDADLLDVLADSLGVLTALAFRFPNRPG